MEITQDIQFIINNQGKRIFAVIPMDLYNSFVEYQKEIEDLEDIQDAELRRNEKSYPINEVFAQIKAN